MHTSLPPLKIVIVDDEELARVRLRGLVHDCTEPQAAVVFEAANTAQALAWLVAHDCDAVLLDVQMPGRDGTQLAAELRQLWPAGGMAPAGPVPAGLAPAGIAPARLLPARLLPAFVFVTAHAQHALKAFDLEATDYLTKPVKRERLQAALQRVAQRRALHGGMLPAGPAAAADEQPVIVVSDRGRVVRVPLGEVLYLKAELKYVTLRTARHTHVIDEPLSDLEARLGHRFLRVHRNALVSRRAVRALERRTIAGEGEGGGDDDGGASGEVWAVRIAPVDEWLAVSRRQVSAVREALLAAGR